MKLPVTLGSQTSEIAVRRADVTFELLHSPVAALEVECTDSLLDQVLEAGLEDHGDGDVYAARLWPSAYAATAVLLRRLAGSGASARSVCEIGCGPGLPSLAALAAGARAVTATDWSPLALALVAHAARGFQPARAPRLLTAQLDVFSTDAAASELLRCDYLVAADMLYDPATAEAVGRHVGQQVFRHGATAILGDPGRRSGRGRAAFVRGVRHAGWPAFECPAFTEEPLPEAWRGVGEKTTVGVCVIEPSADGGT